MTNKKPTPQKQKPVHTIRRGDVIASIHLRQSNCGFPYYDYQLSRTWTSVGSGKETQGGTFFAKNQQELVELIGEASDWIQRKTGVSAAEAKPQPLKKQEPSTRSILNQRPSASAS